MRNLALCLALSLLCACASTSDSVREGSPAGESSALAAAKTDARMAAGLPPFAQGNRAMKYPAT
jgi:hypothetical protein